MRFEEALLKETVTSVADAVDTNEQEGIARDGSDEAQEDEEIQGATPVLEVRPSAGRKVDKQERKKKEKARAEAARRGIETEEARRPKQHEEVFSMFEDSVYERETPQGIKVWREDQYTAENAIDDVSDFTVASYLMDNRVTL